MTVANEISPGKNHTTLIWSGIAFVLIVIGFAGLDPWIYKNVSQQINTGNAASRDIYQSYKTVFWSVRIIPYVVFGTALWLIGVNKIGFGWRGVVASLAGFGVGAGVANILQMAIGRMRPNALEAESHLSFHAPLSGLWSDHADGFPSGEAAATMSLAATLCLIAPRLSWLWIGIGLLGPVIRVIPGMHYFSDVVAGAWVGMILAYLVGRWVLDQLNALAPPADRPDHPIPSD